MKHRQRHIEDLPHIPISPKNDIATIDSVIKHYLASPRGPLSPQAQLRQVRVLQKLRRRLAEVPRLPLLGTRATGGKRGDGSHHHCGQRCTQKLSHNR